MGKRFCRVCANERSRESHRARSSFNRGDHKTECVRGHPWIEENIYVKPSTGHRSCRACHREDEARKRTAT